VWQHHIQLKNTKTEENFVARVCVGLPTAAADVFAVTTF